MRRILGQPTFFDELPCSQIEEHQASQMPYEKFIDSYLAQNLPIVIKGALTDTLIFQRWTFETLVSMFGEESFLTNSYFVKASLLRLHEIVARIHELERETDHPLRLCSQQPALYLQGWKLTSDKYSQLVDEMLESLPTYFTPNWLNHQVLASQIGHIYGGNGRYNWANLFLAAKAGRTLLHWDTLATHSGMAMLQGHKFIVLFPPEASECLYPYPLENKSTPRGPYFFGKDKLSQVNQRDGSSDIYAPDLSRFPLFAQSKPWIGLIGPGDICVIPSGWWHDVISLSSSLMLNCNWVNATNFEPFAQEWAKQKQQL